MWRLAPVLIICMLFGACGGAGGSSSPATSGGQFAANPAPFTDGGTAQPQTLTPVNLSGGTSASGVDITVVSATASPAPNAQDLGVNDTGVRASASNTGGVIHRGSTMRVVLFGPGLNGQMQVRIAGPSDITVSGITGIQATDNTPGIAFIAAASGKAALGARSVYLQNATGDVTSFTGGLEVVP